MSDGTPGSETFGESSSRGGEASSIDDRTQTYGTFGESSTRGGGNVASQSPGSVDEALGSAQERGQQSAGQATQAAVRATERAQAEADER